MTLRKTTKSIAYPWLGLGAAAIVLSLAGCGDDNHHHNNNQPSRANFTGAVYTMTNAADGNQVVVFSQAPDGSLKKVQTVDAGAAGPGPSPKFPAAPIATQNEMVLSSDHHFLFVVDAGDNRISSFKVRNPDQVNRKGQPFSGSLKLVDTISSGGQFPSSLAVHDNLQYVVNARGNGGNITGFTFDDKGQLTAIPNSTQPLSGKKTPLPGSQVLPGDIVFSPDGKSLVVTEKATSLIDTYAVSSKIPSAPDVQKSTGTTPFGATFDANGHLIVSNANTTAPRKGVPNGSSLSSYNIDSSGTLNVISAEKKTFFTVACWVQLSENQKYVYTTNTASDNITGYRVGSDGSLTLLNSDGFTAGASVALLDEAVAGSYLYVNAPAAGGVIGYKISKDGSLPVKPGIQAGNLPAKTNEGIAAFQF